MIRLTGRAEIRAATAEIKRWKAAAKAEGRTLSAWIRRVANQAAR